ncbi:MAG: hypothetical protein KDA80_23465, partial [Planctomycetaceae bacterium]|nr:hypothetical protein [Planctomycetaceae bacterium]
MTISFLIEANRIRELLIRDRTIGNFWNSPNPDSTFLFPLVLLGPFCLGFRFYSATTKSLQDDATARQTGVRPPSRVLRILAPTTIFVLSLAVSVRTTMLLATHERPSRTFRDETPVIHDEFSYLLQAKTFLSRRWFWESSPVARELFHQMHVLNDGKFASRYLPGTGLWIAPWLAMGHPRWGHWFAQGSVAVAAYLLSKRLTEMSRADGKRLPNGPGLAGIPTASWSGLIAGIVAGTLIALSPGLALFSNLMLSHHPTLVGLSLFLWAFLHLMETSAMRWSLLSGAGLAFAMICRPLTAAAVGLPWGFWWLFQV